MLQSDLNVEPLPKVFLQNKLSRCRNKLTELEPVLQAKSMFIVNDPLKTVCHALIMLQSTRWRNWRV